MSEPWLPAKKALRFPAMANGLVLHEGPSPIDGEPIVSIATLHSNNRKTGDMVQIWILRQDMAPMEAIKSGGDRSICGGCPHRGTGTKRSCYVNVFRAPAAIWQHSPII